MPHVGFGRSKPIHERSGRELVVVFVIAPYVIAAAILAVTGWMTYHHHADFSPGDWFGVAWVLIVVPVLIIGLPAAAWQEWQRRKQFGSRKDRHS